MCRGSRRQLPAGHGVELGFDLGAGIIEVLDGPRRRLAPYEAGDEKTQSKNCGQGEQKANEAGADATPTTVTGSADAMPARTR